MLKKISIFGAPAGVRINQGDNFKTSVGGLISVLAILSIIALSLGTVLKFYLEEDEYD